MRMSSCTFARRRFRRERKCQERRVGCHDAIVRQAAHEPEPGNAERPVLVGLVRVRVREAGFAHAPRDPELGPVGDLPVDHRVHRLPDERPAHARQEELGHQVLEHRAAPRHERGIAVVRGHETGEREPVLLRELPLRDRDEAGQARLGSEEVVVAPVAAAIRRVVPDGEESARRVVEEAVGRLLGELPTASRQPRQCLDPLARGSRCGRDGGRQGDEPFLVLARAGRRRAADSMLARSSSSSPAIADEGRPRLELAEAPMQRRRAVRSRGGRSIRRGDARPRARGEPDRRTLRTPVRWRVSAHHTIAALVSGRARTALFELARHAREATEQLLCAAQGDRRRRRAPRACDRAVPGTKPCRSGPRSCRALPRARAPRPRAPRTPSTGRLDRRQSRRPPPRGREGTRPGSRCRPWRRSARRAGASTPCRTS